MACHDHQSVLTQVHVAWCRWNMIGEFGFANTRLVAEWSLPGGRYNYSNFKHHFEPMMNYGWQAIHISVWLPGNCYTIMKM